MADGGMDQPVRIFINYRREDTRAEAGRLYDWLQERFGKDNVFKDIDTIRPGMDFRRSIDEALTEADVVLALIGKHWLRARDAQRRPRLDNPGDFVRLELEGALRRPDVLVIPVLVEGAEMPHADEFPEGLRDLAFRHAVDLADGRWRTDVDRLIAEIERVAGEAKRAGAPTEVAVAAVSAPEPAPRPAAPPPEPVAPQPGPAPPPVPPARRPSAAVIAGAIAITALATVLIVLLLTRDAPGPVGQATPSPSASPPPSATPSPPSPSPSASPSLPPTASPTFATPEALLLSHVPLSILDTCTSEAPLTPAVAALRCGPEGIFGGYILYPGAASMNDAYEASVAAYVTVGMGGSCETDVTAEGTYTDAGATAGRIACYIGSDGDAWIRWTHDTTNILGYASRFDDDSAALYTYWQGAVPD